MRFEVDHADTLCADLKLVGLPVPVREYVFALDDQGDPVRRWRFDLAYVDLKIAIEVDGGLLTGGRHGGQPSAVRDIEKRLAAAVLGWRVLHFRPAQVTSGEALVWIEAALGRRKPPLRAEDRGWPVPLSVGRTRSRRRFGRPRRAAS